jgi:TANFOR domain-containing protein
MRKQTLVSFILLVFAASKLAAQPYQLTLAINVNPPYSADYTDYFTSLNQISLTIVNSSPVEQSIYLAGSVSTLDGGIFVRTSEEERWPGDALIIPAGPSSTQLTGVNLQPFVENSNVEYGGIAPEDLISGLLPEGEYQVCLRAYDFDNLIPVSENHCSNTFTIAYPPPPVLNTPMCEAIIERTAPPNILFSWQTPLGIPAGTLPSYYFTLVQLPDGIDAQSALENTTDPIYEYQTNGTSLSYGIAEPLLQTGRTYAWRVKVEDFNEEIEFQNEGYSEPCTFTYVEPGSSGSPFTLVYPLSGDTIPWSHTPIIHRFDPYSNEYIFYEHDFYLRRNGNQIDAYFPENEWRNGPQQAQSRFRPDITQEQSQHLSLYKAIDLGAIPFISGSVYDWDADIQLTRSPSTLITGSLEGEFVSGMGRPRPIAPLNNDSVMKNLPVTLRFLTSAPPSRFLPPYNIIQADNAHPTPAEFDGGIDERWLLEVSRSADFDSIVTSRSRRIGQGLSYHTTLCREECLVDSLYRDETFQFTPSDTGYYYWRVRWMLDPSSSSIRLPLPGLLTTIALRGSS